MTLVSSLYHLVESRGCRRTLGLSCPRGKLGWGNALHAVLRGWGFPRGRPASFDYPFCQYPEELKAPSFPTSVIARVHVGEHGSGAVLDVAQVMREQEYVVHG